MYQPLHPWKPLGLMWTTTHVPGGASDVALKLKEPRRNACTESFGLAHALRRGFKVNVACGRRRSHSVDGKCGSADASLAKKLCLKVWMTFSVAFRLWICGWTR